MKTCCSCNQAKSLFSFSRDKRNKDGLKYSCKECDKINNNIRYLNKKQEILDKCKVYYLEKKSRDPNFGRNRALKQKFGLTVETRQRLLDEQDGKCAICLKLESDSKQRFVVDHCHKTGRIRGILCSKCNSAIGLLEENRQSILRAAAYLDGKC